MQGIDRAVGQETASTLSSNLFPSLFERLAVSRRLTIFDVGTAVSTTVDFFSQFRCLLHFTNLYDEAVVRDDPDPDAEVSEDELVEQFQSALDLPPDTQIDICLFWDFLNYLDGPALRAFIRALRPFVHEDTRAHGFGMLNAKTVLANQRYGIKNLDCLSLHPRSDSQLAIYPHSQRELIELLGYFRISKSRLMADGRLEFLLNCKVASAADTPKAMWDL